MEKYFAGCSLLLALAGYARADAPLAPPQVLTVCSSNKQFCAVSSPVDKTTRLSAEPSRQTLWSIPGWHRWLFVSDDGDSVVVGYSGMNLVPVDVTLKEPVLTFYHRGDLKRTVTLGDLYQSKSQLERTVSHYAWVRGVALNKNNQLVVELVDGKRVAFAAATGESQRVRADGT